MRKVTIMIGLQLLCIAAFSQDREWFSESDITGLNFPGDARDNAVSFVIGDTAYVGTGDKGNTTLIDFWKYAINTNTWTRIADFPGNKRSNAVTFVVDGKGYVGTGRSGATLFKDFYSYDPATGTWNGIADLPGVARRSAVAFGIDGKGYVGTGCDDSGCGLNSELDDLWMYDPNADSWTQKDTPVPSARGGAVAFTINGKGYIAAGIGSDTKNIQEYDPATDTYTRGGKNDGLYTRRDGVAFVVDGKAYIGLGTQKKDFFVFDPTNTYGSVSYAISYCI